MNTMQLFPPNTNIYEPDLIHRVVLQFPNENDAIIFFEWCRQICESGVEEVSPPSPAEHLCDFPLDPKHGQEFACYGCGSIWKWCKHENEWGTIGQIEGGGL